MRIDSYRLGFTLIEIMIAVAVIVILIGVAVPAYNDYAVRAKVSECIRLAGSAKTAVNARVLRNGLAPGSSTQAGFRFESTEHCGDIRISDGGTVVVEMHNTGAARDPVVRFRLDLDSVIASVEWNCEQVSGDPAHVPDNCRSPGPATGAD